MRREVVLMSLLVTALCTFGCGDDEPAATGGSGGTGGTGGVGASPGTGGTGGASGGAGAAGAGGAGSVDRECTWRMEVNGFVFEEACVDRTREAPLRMNESDSDPELPNGSFDLQIYHQINALLGQSEAPEGARTLSIAERTFTQDDLVFDPDGVSRTPWFRARPGLVWQESPGVQKACSYRCSNMNPPEGAMSDVVPLGEPTNTPFTVSLDDVLVRGGNILRIHGFIEAECAPSDGDPECGVANLRVDF